MCLQWWYFKIEWKDAILLHKVTYRQVRATMSFGDQRKMPFKFFTCTMKTNCGHFNYLKETKTGLLLCFFNIYILSFNTLDNNQLKLNWYIWLYYFYWVQAGTEHSILALSGKWFVEIQAWAKSFQYFCFLLHGQNSITQSVKNKYWATHPK